MNFQNLCDTTIRSYLMPVVQERPSELAEEEEAYRRSYRF